MRLAEQLNAVVQQMDQAEEAARCAPFISSKLVPAFFDAWKQRYLQCPPTLEAHLALRAEFEAVEGIREAVEGWVNALPELRQEAEGLVEQAQAEMAETGEL